MTSRPPDTTAEDRLDAELFRAFDTYREACRAAAAVTDPARSEAAFALADLIALDAIRSAAAGYADAYAAVLIELHARPWPRPGRTHRGERAG